MVKRVRKYSRAIGGKRYRHTVTFKDKSKAQKRAKEYRVQGKKVRVISELGGWSVYVTE